MAKIVIDSDPSGAWVMVDGTFMGLSPVELDGPEPPSQSVVLDLRMDEMSGSKVIDHSGNGNDGFFMGGVSWADLGVHFNGSTGYLNCWDDPSLDLVDTVAIEAWVKFDSLTADRETICSKGHHFQSYGLIMNNETIIFMIEPLMFIVAGFAAQNNVWYHIVGVYDGTYNKIYVNGNQLPDVIKTLGNLEITPFRLQVKLWKSTTVRRVSMLS